MDLNFDTGLIELQINGDPNRPLRFNPTDGRIIEGFLGLVARAEEKMKEFQQRQDDLNAKKDGMKDIQYAKEVSALERDTDKFFRAEFDSIFGDGAAEMVFQEASTTALAVNGDYIFMNFMMAIFPYFDTEIKNRSRKVSDLVQDHKAKAKKAAG